MGISRTRTASVSASSSVPKLDERGPCCAARAYRERPRKNESVEPCEGELNAWLNDGEAVCSRSLVFLVWGSGVAGDPAARYCSQKSRVFSVS